MLDYYAEHDEPNLLYELIGQELHRLASLGATDEELHIFLAKGGDVTLEDIANVEARHMRWRACTRRSYPAKHENRPENESITDCEDEGEPDRCEEGEPDRCEEAEPEDDDVNPISVNYAVMLVCRRNWSMKHVEYFAISRAMLDVTGACPCRYPNPNLQGCIEANLMLQRELNAEPLENLAVTKVTLRKHKLWFSEASTKTVYEVDIYNEDDSDFSNLRASVHPSASE